MQKGLRQHRRLASLPPELTLELRDLKAEADAALARLNSDGNDRQLAETEAHKLSWLINWTIARIAGKAFGPECEQIIRSWAYDLRAAANGIWEPAEADFTEENNLILENVENLQRQATEITEKLNEIKKAVSAGVRPVRRRAA